MKRVMCVLGGLLLLAVVAYLGYAWGQVDKYPDKLWLHRCNSLEKLHEMESRYPNFEVDICLREDGVLDVTHDEDTTFGLKVDPYFGYLSQHPNSHMWMDVKNLDEDNLELFMHSLSALIGKYRVKKEQLIIESSQWQLMRAFTLGNFYTSYYVDAPKPLTLSHEQVDSVVTRLSRIARSGCVSALSFPGWWYGPLRNQFTDTEIEFLSWRHRDTQLEVLLNPVGRMMLKDPRMKVILVKDKGRYHR